MSILSHYAATGAAKHNSDNATLKINKSVKRGLRSSALFPFREFLSQLLHLLGEVLDLGAVAFKNLRRYQLDCTCIQIRDSTYLSTSDEYRLVNLFGLGLLHCFSRFLELAL